MKITIYTVNECEFSKQEKVYLSSHQLQFEEKNLESNKEFLTEMLAVSDNFAGTPVTKIEKDDGQSVVLKGFTQSEFDEALGFKQAEAAQPPAVTTEPAKEVTPPQTVPPASLGSDLSQTPPAVVNPPTDAANQPPVVSVAPAIPPDPAPSQPPTPPPVVEPPVQLSQESQAVPPAPVVTEPAKPPEDPRLTSVLGNLQSMSGAASATPTDANQPTPTTPSNMPSVPDPNFG